MFSYIDILGWIGTILSLGFYLLLALRKFETSFILGLLAAAIWAIVGIITELPSLIGKEVIILFFLSYGWYAYCRESRK